MVCLLVEGEAQGAMEGVGAEVDIAVGEKQPGGVGALNAAREGVLLAHPAGRKVVDVQDLQGRASFGSEAVENGAGVVAGAVVDRDDFNRDSLLCQEGADGVLDGRFLVAGGHDDGELRVRWQRLGIAAVVEVGDAGQVAVQVDGAPNPGRRDQAVDGGQGPSERAHRAGYFTSGRGQRASTVVEMPPRGRNSPCTWAHTGSQARTTSSSTWLTIFSWKMPRLR